MIYRCHQLRITNHAFCTVSRCEIARTMPRTASLSGFVTVWCILVSPSARTVRFCVTLKPIGLRVRVILSSAGSAALVFVFFSAICGTSRCGGLFDPLHPGNHFVDGFAAQLCHIFSPLKTS